MDRLKQLVIKHQNNFKFLLFAGAAIACLNTLARADFNIILYLYVYYVWHNMGDSKEAQTNEKINSFFIFLFSLLIDFIWVFFWGSRWGEKDDNEAFVHSFVIFFSWIGILLKIVVVFCIGLLEWSNIKSSLPAKLQEKLNAGPYSEQRDEVSP